MDPIRIRLLYAIALALVCFLITGCSVAPGSSGERRSQQETVDQAADALTKIPSESVRKVLESAIRQTETTTGYTQDYFSIPYPNGDVPAETGACTDVVIRAFRNAGVDLQKEVHEDMKANFGEYPQKWGLAKPDTNIDHRRVPNLQAYFTRERKALPLEGRSGDFRPGDVVSWDLDGKGMTHIGIVSHVVDENTRRPMIIHNIGAGTRLEDRLFDWKITGHYRYF
jgi:hypothetical protein